MARFDLSDDEWHVVAPLLPIQTRGPARKDDLTLLNGIFYILLTGAPWRDLPKRYGPRTTVYNRYVRWGRRGIWKAVFETLAEEVDDSLVFIDASIVKAHLAAAGAKKGGLKSRLIQSHASLHWDEDEQKPSLRQK